MDLPDDIFFLILLQFILGPQIEQLIKLESVSKINFILRYILIHLT